MLRYPARIIPTDDGLVLVRLPDVPGAAGTGATEEEALDQARCVLETVLAAHVVDGTPIPAPSDICGAPLVTTDRFSLLGLETTAAS
ncbi:MAG TPA: type II toxin-antitoxin system HicB family antitoxin [Allosphingosinicella sp.]|jgi:predicted RNase H-like HicB family nuclease